MIGVTFLLNGYFEYYKDNSKVFVILFIKFRHTKNIIQNFGYIYIICQFYAKKNRKKITRNIAY
jgi:hypothetical protein